MRWEGCTHGRSAFSRERACVCVCLACRRRKLNRGVCAGAFACLVNALRMLVLAGTSSTTSATTSAASSSTTCTNARSPSSSSSSSTPRPRLRSGLRAEGLHRFPLPLAEAHAAVPAGAPRRRATRHDDGYLVRVTTGATVVAGVYIKILVLSLNARMSCEKHSTAATTSTLLYLQALCTFELLCRRTSMGGTELAWVQ